MSASFLPLNLPRGTFNAFFYNFIIGKPDNLNIISFDLSFSAIVILKLFFMNATMNFNN
jgi:hypothetical protein